MLITAQAAGDPHLTSVDGQSFTFNGLGDFILLQDTDGNVAVQVRAVAAQDTQGVFKICKCQEKINCD